MHFLYVLQSLVDSTYYIGTTHNIHQRLVDHNTGKSRYTKRKIPWIMKYFEEYKTKTEALKREKQIKNWKNTRAIENLIKRTNESS